MQFTPDQIRSLSARFCAECESDIRYALAEGLDPHHEYMNLVLQLRKRTEGATAEIIPHVQSTRPEINDVSSANGVHRKTIDGGTEDFEVGVSLSKLKTA